MIIIYIYIYIIVLPGISNIFSIFFLFIFTYDSYIIQWIIHILHCDLRIFETLFLYMIFFKNFEIYK